MFTVKNVRSFKGRQGIGYMCDLYCNNEKLGSVEDYADGGYPIFRIPSKEIAMLRTFGKEINLCITSEEIVMNCLVDSVENEVSISDMVTQYNTFLKELL